MELLILLVVAFVIVVGFIVYSNWPQAVKAAQVSQPACQTCGAPQGSCPHQPNQSYCGQCGQPKPRCGCPKKECSFC